jgi:hypothetical protein
MYHRDQAVLPLYDLAPTPRLSEKVVSLSQSSRVPPVELTDGRGGGRSQIIRRRESLVLYNPLTTLWARTGEKYEKPINRVDRVPIEDTPSPQASVPPPLFSVRAEALVGEGVGVPIRTRG